MPFGVATMCGTHLPVAMVTPCSGGLRAGMLRACQSRFNAHSSSNVSSNRARLVHRIGVRRPLVCLME